MNVPDRLNHRRRIIYTALRSVLDKDKRIPKLFKSWDKQFAQASTFMVATYVDTWAMAGLLKDDEKRRLSRALMHFMSYDYAALKAYPDEFVSGHPSSSGITSQIASPTEAPVMAKIEPAQIPEIKPSSKPPSEANLPVQVAPLSGHSMFYETMQVILKHLATTGRSQAEILQDVLTFIKERKLMALEPLLNAWAQQNFSLEQLSKLKDPKVMQVLVVMFYKVTSDYITPPKEELKG